jgi:transposase
MGRSNYPPELRERAVRMVAEMRSNYSSQWAAIEAAAEKLGIGTAETLRKWVRRAEVDSGQRAGVTSEEHAKIKRLKPEVAELRRANEILKAASAFFAELDRPQRRSRGSSTSTRVTASAPTGCGGVSSRSAPCSPTTVLGSPRRPNYDAAGRGSVRSAADAGRRYARIASG